MDSQHGIYEHAEIYDIAFDFKDFAAECSFMAWCHEEVRGHPPFSWLEMAAGPGRHTIEMARRGLTCTALDLSKEMVGYGRQLAAAAEVDFDYLHGDMTDFHIDEPVDLAAILLDSISLVLDAEALDRHFRCVADALVDGGIYVLELSHPSDAFGEKTAGTEWETERDGTKVSIAWGTEEDPFDPVTQINETNVRITVSEAGRTWEINERCLDRVYTSTEFRALVRASGCFDMVAQYGAMDRNIDLHHPKAWRNICVLQKR